MSSKKETVRSRTIIVKRARSSGCDALCGGGFCRCRGAQAQCKITNQLLSTRSSTHSCPLLGLLEEGGDVWRADSFEQVNCFAWLIWRPASSAEEMDCR